MNPYHWTIEPFYVTSNQSLFDHDQKTTTRRFFDLQIRCFCAMLGTVGYGKEQPV